MKRALAILVPVLFGIPLSLFAAPKNYVYHTSEGRTLYLPYDTIQSITPVDLGGDGTSEIVLGSPPGFVGEVYLIRLDGSIINSWQPYHKDFKGGVNVATGDLDQDGVPEIVTAPAGGGGPHVRIFDGFGRPKLSVGFFAGPREYRGGISIAVQRTSDQEPLAITAILNTEPLRTFKAFTAQGKEIKSYPFAETVARTGAPHLSIAVQKNRTSETITIPKTTQSIERGGKVIVIDLSDQTLSRYQDGYRLATFPTSTGKPGYATPVGEYAVNRKTDLAYSRTYGLYMPYWMSFIGDRYGIHELPYWPNGYREGEDHLGAPVSHGCVRLGIGPAKTLYEWAEVGTPVIVQP